MSLMTENKAKELLKAYMEAELSGDNDLAAELEDRLKKAGWIITVGPEGTTIVREGGGLFGNGLFSGSTNENVYIPQERYTVPYTGSSQPSGSNVPVIIGISVGALLLILTIVLIVKVVNQRRTNALA